MILPYGDLEVSINLIDSTAPWWGAPGAVRDFFRVEIRGPFDKRFQVDWWGDPEDHRRGIVRPHKIAWNALQTLRRAKLDDPADFELVFSFKDRTRIQIALAQAKPFSLREIETALQSAADWWQVEQEYWDKASKRRGSKEWVPTGLRAIPAPPPWFEPQYF